LACRLTKDGDTRWDYVDRILKIGDKQKDGRFKGWGMEILNERFLMGEFSKKGYFIKRGSYFDLKTNQYSVGKFDDSGLMQGFGETMFKDGDSYTGDWRDDKFQGNGCFKFSSVIIGLKYTGGFKVGKCHGKGTVVFPDGFEFTDEFVDNKPTSRTKSIHPKLRSLIQKDLCTMNASKPYCLWLYRCKKCKARFCETCWKSCHIEEDHPSEEIWRISSTDCSCQKCQSDENITKRQKIK